VTFLAISNMKDKMALLIFPEFITENLRDWTLAINSDLLNPAIRKEHKYEFNI
jgi:hypothetical protein